MRAAVHLPVGVVAGLAFGATRPGQTQDYGALVELLGAAIGGGIGGLVPDLLEPADHPRHRSTAHSVLALGGVYLVNTQLQSWQGAIRAQALDFRQRREVNQNGSDNLLLLLGELLCFAFAGLIAGILAGYVSHLVLDLVTPDGLPLVVRGF